MEGSRDQPLAIYGKGSQLETAVLITGWSRNLIFCSDGDAGLANKSSLHNL